MVDRDALSRVAGACEAYEVEETEHVQRVRDMIEVCESWGWWRGIDKLDKCIPEQKFLIDIGSGVRLKGFIDRLDITGTTATILDIKTQAKKFTRDELRNNLQASIYNIGARHLYNVEGPIRVEFWCLRHEIQAVTKTEHDAEKDGTEIIKLCKQAMNYIENEPTASSGNHCRWCNYMEKCPEWTN
jgi:RecB family exonuclease